MTSRALRGGRGGVRALATTAVGAAGVTSGVLRWTCPRLAASSSLVSSNDMGRTPSSSPWCRPLYHKSTGTGIMSGQQQRRQQQQVSAFAVAAPPGVRSLFRTTSSSSDLALLGTVAKDSPCRNVASTGIELRGLRRCFSVTTRRLDSKKDETANERSSPASPSAEPRGIGKVLPLPKAIKSLTPHENIYTLPNILTFSRLIAAPFIGYAILHDAHTWALGLFVYAGVSDLLDGWIARRWKLQTVVGSVVDPMADKMLMTVLTVCLAVKGGLPVWLAAIILGRDVGLGIAAIYYRWISLPPPKTMTRYWDFSLPSAEVRPTTISKYNTFLQLALMGATTLAPVLATKGIMALGGVETGVLLTGLQYIVATTTIWSGLSYVFSKDAVKILSHGKDKDKKDEA